MSKKRKDRLLETKKWAIKQYGRIPDVQVVDGRRMVDAEFVNFLIEQVHTCREQTQRLKSLVQWDATAKKVLQEAGK